MEKFKLEVPVVFIVFNRLDCAIEVFEKIRMMKPSKLYVVADGARPTKDGEIERVAEVRKYIQENVDWECDVKYNFAEKNMGCKYRISSGLSWVFEKEDRAIILEDDCVPNSDFFQFCQEMLELYKDDDKVWMISGSNLTRKQKTKDEYFFSKFPEIWGWATWKRAWEKIDLEMLTWPDIQKSGALRYAYDPISYRCFLRIADHQTRLKRSSWAIPWQYTIVANHGVGIYPSQNLVSNVGHGRADATNTLLESDDDFSYGKSLNFPHEKINNIIIDEKFDKGYLQKRLGIKKEWGYIKYLFSRVLPKLKEKLNK